MKRKIRLMHITHDLAIGGLQQVVVNICRTIDRQKYDVSVLCLRNLGEFSGSIEAMGIKVMLLEKKEKGADYFAFLKVAKILKNMNIDVVHTHNTQPLVDGVLGALIAGVKTVIHTDHARTFPDKWRYMFAEWVMSNYVFRVVGVSEDTSRNLRKYEKISSKKISTIPNGVYKGTYSIDIDVKVKKNELGIEGNGFVIGVCARLIEQKGISDLLLAMPDILRKYGDLTLIIAGTGYYEDNLKKLAVDIGIKNNVRFLGPRTDIPSILKVMDLYVLPSYSEGLPMTLLEAMAAGCPIVSTDVGGIGTVIRNGVSGVLVEPRNPRMLSDEILRVLGNDSDRKLYIKNAGEIFDREFSAEKMTQRYQDLYESGLYFGKAQ